MRRDLGAIDWILIAAVVLAVLYVVVVAIRKIAIRRPGGAVECSLRQEGDDRWRRGVAAYRTDQLYWFSSRGVCLRPNAAFDRHSLQLVARHDHDMARPPRAARQTVVVRFEAGTDREPVWLALSRDALTGLLAWLEAGPQHWFRGIF